MALLSDLVSAVAEVEGIEESFVIGVARYLREAGLIRQAGRGRGAAKMRPEDAVSLVIAVNGSEVAKEAPRIFQTYASLQWVSLREGPDHREDPFKNLFSDRISFGDALERLIILAIPDGQSCSELERFMAIRGRQMDLEFWRPFPRVNFRVHFDGEQGYLEIERGTFLLSEPKAISGDRFDKVSISHKTLIAVGKVLAI